MPSKITTEERFWSKVAKLDNPNGCWLWTAATNGEAGYGVFNVMGHRPGRHILAHRYSYETLIGPIPIGLELDHLCRIRRCVNPAHLEPVTRQTNLLRGIGVVPERAAQTHCVRKHPLDLFNTYHWRGHRRCKQCNNMKAREYRARLRST